VKRFCVPALIFALVLTGCTLVVIHGSENEIKDAGKMHGGQLNIQPPAKAPAPASQPHPLQNLLRPGSDTHH
jgi:hypothetical protein